VKSSSTDPGCAGLEKMMNGLGAEWFIGFPAWDLCDDRTFFDFFLARSLFYLFYLWGSSRDAMLCSMML
jgi:hypothetical protein